MHWIVEWHKVVFSDESRFCLRMHDGRMRVRRRRGERRDIQFPVERHVHRAVGVMVWGAIAYGSRSQLVFIQTTMNAQHYIDEVVEPHILPYLQTLEDPLFQQDNAPSHVARISINRFEEAHVIILPWPPKSPRPLANRTSVGHYGTKTYEFSQSPTDTNSSPV
ncbi:transposable element-related [Holotrichia oblita]|uniref:Transposable element-related n=1 Tax=Holotrichia oblita TaxID=644536 RepID=A0ACB9TE29_HOLOL|nr:transposable element-related [Holotrichia oblita]